MTAHPGTLRAEPLFLKETKFGPLLLFVTAVSVSSGDAPPVLLTPESRFRIRGRLPTAGAVVFGLTTHFPTADARGNSAPRASVTPARDASGTFELELRLADLQPEETRSPRSAAGLTMEDCWCLTVHADKGLELVQVELLNGPG